MLNAECGHRVCSIDWKWCDIIFSVIHMWTRKQTAPTSSMWPWDGKFRRRSRSSGRPWRGCVPRGNRHPVFRPAAATGPTMERATTGRGHAGARPRCRFIASWRRSTPTVSRGSGESIRTEELCMRLELREVRTQLNTRFSKDQKCSDIVG